MVTDEAAAFAAVERCQQITWQPDRTHLGSQVALLKEYLRRSAVVAGALNSPQNWPWDDYAVSLPLPDINPHLLPGFSLLEDAPAYVGPGLSWLEGEVLALILHMNEKRSHPGWYGNHACGWYIRWASVKSLPSVAALNLSDPYEPLLTFYERGGWLRPEQGYLDLDGANVTLIARQTAAAGPPLLSLAPSALDALAPSALDALDILQPWAWVKEQNPVWP